jgi:hypothetical protein
LICPILQKFVDAVLVRYQNVDPNKDSNNIKKETDVKNELQIVTLSTGVYQLWEEFLTRHMEGTLIDPCTLQPYRSGKNFSLKNFELKREFFKHMGHFTDKDLHEYVLHLLGSTTGRKREYPKVSIGKTKFHCADNTSHTEWVERRKRKKIVLEELMMIDPSLKFKDSKGDVIDEVWRAWKLKHLFTSASWDFLLNGIPNGFFVKRLTNEGKKKTAIDYKERPFPTVYPLLKRFLKLKNKVEQSDGDVYIRGHECYPQAFVTSHTWPYHKRGLPFGIIDFRVLTRPTAGAGDAAPVLGLLKFLGNHMRPSLSGPEVWLWIPGNSFEEEEATTFTKRYLKQYEVKVSTYNPCKIENTSSRAVQPSLTLLFLIRKEEDGVAKWLKYVKKVYDTSDNTFYTALRFNTEAKLKVHQSELRMEFYIDILQSFAVKGENVLSVYSGSKFLLAAKVTIQNYPLIIFESKILFTVLKSVCLYVLQV